MSTTKSDRLSKMTSSTDDLENQLKPLDDMLEYLWQYTKEKPEVVVLTALGVGFILGWKLKPW